MHDEGARQRDALLLATAQVLWIVGQPLAKADAPEQVAGSLDRVPPIRNAPAQFKRQQDVLEGVEVRQQLERLEYETDALGAEGRPAVLVAGEQVLAEEPDGTCRGNVESRQQSEQCRLARTGGADDRNRLAGCDPQIDIIENREASRRVLHDLAEAACLNRGLDCNVSHVHHSVRRNFLIRSGLASLAALLACLAPAASSMSSVAAKGASGPVLLVVGDSLSAEYGLPRGTGWVQLLADRLRTSGMDYRVVNVSISGETTSGGRSRLPALLKQHQPKIVVLELGANDGLRGLPLNVMTDNLAAMIQQSRAAGAKVLLVGVQVPPNYGRDYAERFAAAYAALARENKAVLVPFLMEGFAERLEFFQPDRIHPTVEAQPRMLDNVWPALQPLVGGKPKR